MGGIGPLQILAIVVVILILFGAGKLPSVMGDIAKGVKNFRQGLKDEEKEESQSISDQSEDKTNK